MKDKKEIEQIVKEKFENFQPDVPDSLWSSIESSISTPPPSFAPTLSVGSKIIAVAVGVSIIIGSALIIYNNQVEDVAVAATIGQQTESKEVPEEYKSTPPTEINTKIISVETSENWKEIQSPKEVRIKVISPKEETERRKHSSVADMHISKSSRKVITLQDLDKMQNMHSNEQGVDQLDSVTVIVENPEENSLPFASIIASVVGGNAPLEVEFDQQSVNGSVSWNFGDGNSSSERAPTYIYTNPGIYYVKLSIQTENGDLAADEKMIEVLEPDNAEELRNDKRSQITSKPNVFTPNGDGINDYMSVGAENMESFHFLLLDMNTNKIIFETSNPAFQWDGTLSTGNTISKGTYIYIIRAKGHDGQKFDESGALSVQ